MPATQAPPLKNLVVATDFSEGAEAALAYGATIGARFEAVIHLLHIVEPEVAGDPGMMAAGTQRGEIERVLTADALDELHALLSPEDQKLVRIQFAIEWGIAADEIVRYAREHGADLIVIGTHGQSEVKDLFMGNVAESVLRRAPCPVLAVRTATTKVRVEPDAAA